MAKWISLFTMPAILSLIPSAHTLYARSNATANNLLFTFIS
jgi:hypothetical protein